MSEYYKNRISNMETGLKPVSTDDTEQDHGAANAFGEMMAGLKEKADEKWGFWKKAIAVLGQESEIYKECEPKYLNKGTLIVKCNNDIVRYELYRVQFEMMNKINEFLSKEKQIMRIVFR